MLIFQPECTKYSKQNIIQKQLHLLDRIGNKMNSEARVVYNSILNDSKLLPLSSFKSTKFSKYNLFPHAQTLPTFFEHNLQNEGRIVKFLKGPQAVLRGFYYQLFKLAFEMQNDLNYPIIIKNIVFSPTLTTHGESPISGKQYSISQYKRIVGQFINLMESQVIPNAQLTFSQYPIIDEAMLALLELILQKLQEQQKLSSQGNAFQILAALCQIFHIQFQIYQNCFSFEQADVFLYIESQEVCYLAFLSQMAEVQSYQKTSQSPLQIQARDNSSRQNIGGIGGSSTFLQAHYHSAETYDPQKDIRLSAGNKGSRTRITNKNIANSDKGNFKSSSFGGSSAKFLYNDYEDRASPSSHDRNLHGSKASKATSRNNNESKGKIDSLQQFQVQKNQNNFKQNQQIVDQNLMKKQSRNTSKLQQNLDAVLKNVFQDIGPESTPQIIISQNSLAAFDQNNERQFYNEYFPEKSSLKIQNSLNRQQNSSKTLPVSSLNVLQPSPSYGNESASETQKLIQKNQHTKQKGQNQNLNQKSLYDVQTYKSITDSIQQSKYSKIDSNYDKNVLLGTIGQYMLINKKETKNNNRNTQAKDDNNDIYYTSNVSYSKNVDQFKEVIDIQQENKRKQRLLQKNESEERPTQRKRSQVKVKNKIFEYQFKAHKCRNYSILSNQLSQIEGKSTNPITINQTATLKHLQNKNRILLAENKSSPVLPPTITDSNLSVNVHLNLHLNLSNINSDDDRNHKKMQVYPTQSTSKQKTKFQDSQNQAENRINIDNKKQWLDKTVNKNANNKQYNSSETYNYHTYLQNQKTIPIKTALNQNTKSQKDVDFYKPTLKNLSHIPLPNHSNKLDILDTIRKSDTNIQNDKNKQQALTRQQKQHALHTDTSAFMNNANFKTKGIATTTSSYLNRANDDTLGTFYREFSDTKIMEVMSEPFKTNVRSTRHKFKGIRSKNFRGFF